MHSFREETRTTAPFRPFYLLRMAGLPMEGISVVELTTMVAGPSCGRALCDCAPATFLSSHRSVFVFAAS